MLIDTHSHLNFNAYRNDVDEVVKRSLENNVWMINVGSQYNTSKRAVEIVQKYPQALQNFAKQNLGGQGVYAAIGLHPIH